MKWHQLQNSKPSIPDKSNCIEMVQSKKPDQ
jgi:hypothetical protein